MSESAQKTRAGRIEAGDSGQGAATSPIKAGAAVALLLASALTLVAGAVVAPSLPGLRAAFAEQDNIDLLARLVLTVPALGVVLAAPLVGALVDRMGRRWVLVAGLVVYGLAGTSGLWLATLTSILVGRLVLGAAVAAVMTAATTLIADLTVGAVRGRLLGIQAAFMGLGGLVLLTLGGRLVEVGWRWPFAVYLVAWTLVPLTLFFVDSDQPKARAAEKERAAGLPGKMLLLYGAALLGMLLFYLVPVQLPFLLRQRLAARGTHIGLCIGVMPLASSLSSLSLGWVRRRPASDRLLALTFVGMAPGLAQIGWSSTWTGILAGTALLGTAAGLLMPNLNLWTSELVSAAQRGRALGYVTTAIFLGQFLSPILTLPVIAAGASLGTLFLLSAALSVVFGTLVLFGDRFCMRHLMPRSNTHTEI